MSQQTTVALENDEEKVSYGFGMQFGEQLKRNGFEGLDLEAVFAGVRDSYEGHELQIDESTLNAAYQVIHRRKQAELAARQAQAEQAQAGFLQENAQRDGVITTDSGLQYEVLVSGAGGEKPTASSTVVTHYHGSLPDGTVFDSSVNRGEPASFGVNQVIAGWTEALQMMSVGDKWRIVCPPQLAYGESGAGDAVPPNAVLVFEIELLAIK